MSLKESWKKVGQDFGSLGKDLGSSIVKSVKTGAKKVSEIGDKDEKEEPKADVVIDPQPENQEPDKKEE